MPYASAWLPNNTLNSNCVHSKNIYISLQASVYTILANDWISLEAMHRNFWRVTRSCHFHRCMGIDRVLWCASGQLQVTSTSRNYNDFEHTMSMQLTLYEITYNLYRVFCACLEIAKTITYDCSWKKRLCSPLFLADLFLMALSTSPTKWPWYILPGRW